jgi:TolB-like protein/Tfp pilus assembly protein PilF
VLVALLERPHELVTREELQQRLWPDGVSVDFDNNLNSAVSRLRDALRDGARKPKFIETVHHHGYRFVADVVGDRKEAEDSAPSIAVLPFTNLSAAPESEYFCDGLAEELLNALMRVSDLRVVARTSAFSLKHQQLDVQEIGRRLNAAVVLEGSVQRTGNRVRILTQLINTADGYHLWSERFDREMDDIFAIQDEIAEAILSKLRVRLADIKTPLVKRHTENVEAYTLYLKGRYYWNKRFVPGSMQSALDNFHKVISIDPHYALAYSGLADCYNLVGIFQFRAAHEVFPKAKEYAEKAVSLDDELAEAHASLAYTCMLYDWDWQRSEHEFKKALIINPSYAQAHLWYAQYLAAMTRFDEAIAEGKRAQGIDPTNLSINANVALVLYWAHENKRSIEQLEQTLALDPDFGLTSFYLGNLLTVEGRYAEGIAVLEKAVEKTGGMPLLMAHLGLAYGRSGERAKANKLLRELEVGLWEITPK